MNGPDPAERGRFALYPQEKGMIIAYVTGLCDTCQGCGCGQQQEPIDLTPQGVTGLLAKMGGLKALRGMIRL
jgi:hypothetical protein